jgi:hypothetical protein
LRRGLSLPLVKRLYHGICGRNKGVRRCIYNTCQPRPGARLKKTETPVPARDAELPVWGSRSIDEDRLPPTAWRLVGPVNAACPAAGPRLPRQQLCARLLDATTTRRRSLCVIDPADELVPTERRQLFPQSEDLGIRAHGRLKVFRGAVDGSLGKSVRHETFRRCRRSPAARRGCAPRDRSGPRNRWPPPASHPAHRRRGGSGGRRHRPRSA